MGSSRSSAGVSGTESAFVVVAHEGETTKELSICLRKVTEMFFLPTLSKALK